MKQKKWTFPVLKAARWAAPQDNDTGEEFEDWILWVRVKDLPMDFPLDPNARYPNLSKPTPRAIAATLDVAPGEFVKRNSGLCMVARACRVKENVVTLFLNMVTEDEEHEEGRRGDGILNGGHTYEVIRTKVKKVEKDGLYEGQPDPLEAVVRIEVQTGIAEDDLADISRARNKSEPVAEFSLMNLGNEWTALKKVLPDNIRRRVAFMENDPEAPEADYDVGDLVRLLALFNNKVYQVGKTEPFSAYTSEKRLIAKWDAEDYKHLLPHLLDIIKLHDGVVLQYVETLKGIGKVNGVISYGEKNKLVLLSGKKSTHFVPPPFTYPVLAALRVFLTDDGSKWYVSPEELLKNPAYVKELIDDCWSQYKNYGRSSATFFGRNKQVWQLLSLKAMVKRHGIASAA